MSPEEFKTYLLTNKRPIRIIIELNTTQQISKNTFGGEVRKYSRFIAWVNFHLQPQKFTESTDPNYFRLPKWGTGNYPIFKHPGLNKEYIGLLPEVGEEKDVLFYIETPQGNIKLSESEVRKHLPKKLPAIDGYPVYFNARVENIVSVEVIK